MAICFLLSLKNKSTTPAEHIEAMSLHASVPEQCLLHPADEEELKLLTFLRITLRIPKLVSHDISG